MVAIALAGRSPAPSAFQVAAEVPHQSLPIPTPPRENGTDGLMGRLPFGPLNDTPVTPQEREKPVAGPALKPGGLERRP